MKIIAKKYLTAFYGVTGSVTTYADGSARLRIKQTGKLLHNKIHKNERAAMAAWYRANA